MDEDAILCAHECSIHYYIVDDFWNTKRICIECIYIYIYMYALDPGDFVAICCKTPSFLGCIFEKLRFSKKREDLGDEYLWGAGSSFDEDMASWLAMKNIYTPEV